MALNLKPLGDKVVLKKIESSETTKSGIVLPSGSKEDLGISTVLYVGPGTDEVKMEVKPGDKVVSAKYSGTEIKDGDDELSIVSQKDILAIVK